MTECLVVHGSYNLKLTNVVTSTGNSNHIIPGTYLANNTQEVHCNLDLHQSERLMAGVIVTVVRTAHVPIIYAREQDSKL